MLYGYALQKNLRELEFDLISPRATDLGDGFIDMMSRYSEYLAKQCAMRRIPFSWLRSARHRVKFDVKPNERWFPREPWRGDPFQCTVEIEDDFGRKRFAQAMGRCLPHDPARESRSTRA